MHCVHKRIFRGSPVRLMCARNCDDLATTSAQSVPDLAQGAGWKAADLLTSRGRPAWSQHSLCEYWTLCDENSGNGATSCISRADPASPLKRNCTPSSSTSRLYKSACCRSTRGQYQTLRERAHRHVGHSTCLTASPSPSYICKTTCLLSFPTLIPPCRLVCSIHRRYLHDIADEQCRKTRVLSFGVPRNKSKHVLPSCNIQGVMPISLRKMLNRSESYCSMFPARLHKTEKQCQNACQPSGPHVSDHIFLQALLTISCQNSLARTESTSPRAASNLSAEPLRNTRRGVVRNATAIS